ncbi:MAG: hypothetical protein LW806_07075 [Planctomycetaceae bacterium]|nr:hypothetical protein [Planctomycetaceae bacterium]
MARRGGPALYELLDSKRGSAVPSGGLAGGSARARLDPRALRSLVFGAIAIALIVIAYLVGVSRGERIGRAAVEGVAAGVASGGVSSGASSGASGGASGAGAADAESAPRPGSSVGVAGAGDSLRTENPSVTVSSGTMPQGGGPGAAEAGLGPASAGDPRQVGLQYFVLCSTLEPNAIKVVEFCRSKGLDAYVVPDQNGRLREVTVLPGFASGERSSPAIKELEERIRKVGVLFKASGPGNSDFGDRYIKTHRERQ